MLPTGFLGHRCMLSAAALSAEGLAAILGQSVDCVKLIGLDGSILWMNSNGLCAMEIDDFEQTRGQQWSALWPQDARQTILDALPAAAAGNVVRFDAYCPTAKGAPRWWNVTVSKVKGVEDDDAGYLAISRDISEAEMARQATNIAAAELRHRLKNTYAIIGSLLQGFAKGNPELEQFAREMQARLVSLSTAQALFSTDDVPCELAVLIPALIAPCATPACVVTFGQFCDASLQQGQADAIALVVGELAVNSAKHGAIAAGGAIYVTATSAGDLLDIIWKERSNSRVTAHDRTGGQGLRLIERIVQARHGSLTIAWHNDGLTVTLQFRVN